MFQFTLITLTVVLALLPSYRGHPHPPGPPGFMLAAVADEIKTCLESENIDMMSFMRGPRGPPGPPGPPNPEMKRNIECFFKCTGEYSGFIQDGILVRDQFESMLITQNMNVECLDELEEPTEINSCEDMEKLAPCFPRPPHHHPPELEN